MFSSQCAKKRERVLRRRRRRGVEVTMLMSSKVKAGTMEALEAMEALKAMEAMEAMDALEAKPMTSSKMRRGTVGG